jgi:flagellar motor switch protein FliN/FliY
MSSGERMEGNGLEHNHAARALLDQWVQSVAQVIQSMTDRKPQVDWHPGEGPLPPEPAGEPPLWWEQPFRGGPEMEVWVGSPRAVWEHVGTETLKAAGLETVAEAEARNTWIEILGQSLGEMARAIGAVLGHEIGCDAGSERAPSAHSTEWASAILHFDGTDLPPCIVVLSPALLSALSAPPPADPAEDQTVPEPYHDSGMAASKTLELLLDVDLPVSISFGKTQLALRDVLKLMTGSIVELNRGVNEQVDVLVNHCLVARGEVVVVEGNYGVRIQEIASRRDRLRSIQ